MARLRTIASAFAAVWLIAVALEARAQATMSLDQFRMKVIAAVLKADPKVEIETQAPDQLKLSGGKVGERTMFLSNTYGLYLQDPAQADLLIGRLIRVMATSAVVIKPSMDKVVALVRPASFGQFTEPPEKQSAKSVGKGLAQRPLAGDLMVLIAYDQPEAFQYPPLASLEKELGRSGQSLWTLALANSRSRVGHVSVSSVRPGVFALGASDSNFGAALMIDEAVWSQAEVAAIGPHPVVLVGKSGLIAVDGSDVALVQWLQGFADSRDAGDPTWLSRHLYARNAGAWMQLPALPAATPK